MLHKIIEIDTICDQNVSRAYAGYHLVVCKPSTRYISLTMKYNMFKGMVHLVGTLQARIQGGGSEPPTLNFNKQKNKKEAKREREVSYGGKQVIFMRLFVPQYFFFFKLVSEHRGSCGRGGGGGLWPSPRNFSVTLVYAFYFKEMKKITYFEDSLPPSSVLWHSLSLKLARTGIYVGGSVTR